MATDPSNSMKEPSRTFTHHHTRSVMHTRVEPTIGICATHRCAHCPLGVAYLRSRWIHIWGDGSRHKQRLHCVPFELSTLAAPGEPLTQEATTMTTNTIEERLTTLEDFVREIGAGYDKMVDIIERIAKTQLLSSETSQLVANQLQATGARLDGHQRHLRGHDDRLGAISAHLASLETLVGRARHDVANMATDVAALKIGTEVEPDERQPVGTIRWIGGGLLEPGRQTAPDTHLEADYDDRHGDPDDDRA